MAVISVIMGVYNPKDSLRFENAVRSILNQSFKDLELIIYDDGSSKPARDKTHSGAGPPHNTNRQQSKPRPCPCTKRVY